MSTAYIGLGSNLGDRLSTLESAVALLASDSVMILTRSSIYETDPIGGPMQGDFYNQVVQVHTDLDPRGLWERCSVVESLLGRDRTKEERWGPRTIDLDLLVFDDRMIIEEDLVVPHPRLSTRAFVLVPLAEIAPDLVVPGYGQLGDLLARVGGAQAVRRLEV